MLLWYRPEGKPMHMRTTDPQFLQSQKKYKASVIHRPEAWWTRGKRKKNSMRSILQIMEEKEVHTLDTKESEEEISEE